MSGTDFNDIRRFETIDSTNRYLLDEARGGTVGPVVAVADHQTAGRGRLGRTWEAPAGSNLLLSVLFRPDLAADQRQLATAAVSLAAVQAIDRCVGVPVEIKWPNDLTDSDGRKVAGVLAEADLSPQSVRDGMGLLAPIVVGIGINVNWPGGDADLPDGLVGVASSLRRLSGGPVDREGLLEALLASLAPMVDDLDTAEGRSRIASDFRARCSTVGRTVRVELADRSFVGAAVGLSGEGHLLVETDGGTETVIAGDVVHVRSPG